MKFAIGLILMAIAGCSTVPQVHKVEVPVPVVRPCIAESDIPPEPPATLLPGTNVERLAAAVSIDYREQALYTRQLLALLRACAEAPSK